MKNKTDTLKERIILMESQQAKELAVLREQIHLTYDTVKPLTLLKSIFNEVTTSPGLKNNILDNVIGLTTGYLSKKVLVGSTHNPIKKVAGNLLQFAVANIVSKHSTTIKAVGEVIFRRIFANRGKTKNLNVEVNHSVQNQLKKADF
jgi:hypothetical protein